MGRKINQNWFRMTEILEWAEKDRTKVTITDSHILKKLETWKIQKTQTSNDETTDEDKKKIFDGMINGLNVTEDQKLEITLIKINWNEIEKERTLQNEMISVSSAKTSSNLIYE